ncbi:MAG: WXG100 family type VII secretion target [Propionibacteriaceae bacterium]|jgi:uncharacterized protein YukE|nr:WXG100 family type VII secretion target [Propionibacteriaceae bacterium]
MAKVGMSPDEVEGSARDLRGQSQRLSQLQAQIDRLVDEASHNWHGFDIGRFQQQWHGYHRQRLTRSAAGLMTMADTLSTQASDQRQTSQAEATSPTVNLLWLGYQAAPERLDPVSENSGPSDTPTDGYQRSDKYDEIERQVKKIMADQFKNAGLTEEEQAAAIERLCEQLDATPEPWRSLYMENLDKLHLVNGDSGVYYPIIDTAYVDLQNEANNERGSNYTIWHELAHGVDDKEKWFSAVTKDYQINGLDLDDALRADVRGAIVGRLDRFTDDAEQQSRIVDALMNKTTSTLSDGDRAVMNDLVNYFDRQLLSGPDANVASDIFGAMTGNVIGGQGINQYGHEDNYWDSGGDNASSEFWAGYSAKQVIGGEGLSITKELFPNGHKFADQMAEELIK